MVEVKHTPVTPFTPGHLHFEEICFDRKIALRGRNTVYGQPYVVAHVNRPGSARSGDDKKYARLFCAAPDLFEAAAEFCRRVEAGEIRSKRSYAAFKAALSKATTQQEGR